MPAELLGVGQQTFPALGQRQTLPGKSWGTESCLCPFLVAGDPVWAPGASSREQGMATNSSKVLLRVEHGSAQCPGEVVERFSCTSTEFQAWKELECQEPSRQQSPR